MQEISRQYEQLFANLGKQIFLDIENLTDSSDALAVCIRHIETALAAFETHFPDRSVIACKKGCCYCCSFPIECPPQVVVDIARHIKETWPEKEIFQLKKQMARDILARKAPFYRAPCPFLNKENTCSIYEKRPLSCRWFTSPDAGLCEKSVEDGSHVPQHAIRHRVFQTATTMLLAWAKKQGRYGEQVPFISSLLEIME